MNLGQSLVDLAKLPFRPQPGPLHKMSNDDLAAAIAEFETRVRQGEEMVAQLQPALEAAAAEAFAGADLATVKGNQAAVREAEQALDMARTTLAGLRKEVGKRADERGAERAQQRGKELAAAGRAHIDDTKALEAAAVELARAYKAWDASGEAVYAALPVKDRTDFWPGLLRRNLRNLRLRHRLCGLTAIPNGDLLFRAEGILSPVLLAQEPDLVAYLAPLPQMLEHIIFRGDTA